jgi:hypothetical protein
VQQRSGAYDFLVRLRRTVDRLIRRPDIRRAMSAEKDLRTSGPREAVFLTHYETEAISVAGIILGVVLELWRCSLQYRAVNL